MHTNMYIHMCCFIIPLTGPMRPFAHPLPRALHAPRTTPLRPFDGSLLPLDPKSLFGNQRT